jgi:hypothetical protein
MAIAHCEPADIARYLLVVVFVELAVVAGAGHAPAKTGALANGFEEEISVVPVTFS